MWWRREKGGQAWDAVKGEPNRKAFRKLVESGKASGVLALDKNKAVGWCSFGKRTDFPRLERTRAYQREDGDKVWSINCFYIAPGYRKQGLARAMAGAAVKAIRKRKGKLAEAYPVTLTKDGKRLPPSFAYTGPECIFQELGFREIQRLAATRPLYRLEIS
jgi:ribosomal protein S18 acetylase RimI-like enzyme